MANHYATLGVSRTSSAGQIRTAYRKLAIQHHPDRSKAPGSIEIFKRATEAYEVLGDADRRRSYDIDLGLQLKREADKARRDNPFGQSDMRPPSAATRSATPPKPNRVPTPNRAAVQTPRLNLAEDISRLAALFNRGRYPEAEAKAREILDKDSRQPVPYAVLGDLARMGGRPKEATKMYAFAVQMDPGNSLYQRRYEETLVQVDPKSVAPKAAVAVHRPGSGPMAFIVSSLLLAGAFLVLSKERPVFVNLPYVSTWTFGLLAMLFVTGIILGAGLSAGNLIDRFFSTASTSMGRPSPSLGIGLLALVNFWFALIVYGLLGVARRGVSVSNTRVLLGVAATTLVLAGATVVGSVSAVQTVLWGGNVVYVGSLFGWLAADPFRR